MNDIINKQIKAMDYFLNSKEGRKRMENYINKIAQLKIIEERQTDRVWNHIKDNIDFYIEKCIKWYESDKYRDREHKKGYESRESLYWILFDVGKKYGKKCTKKEINKHANMFTGDMVKLGSYVIQVMHGQGSVIRIDKIK